MCWTPQDLTQQNYLEFYVRTDPINPGGAVPSFSVRVRDNFEVHVGNQYLTTPISRYWSRARIPVADLGIDTTQSTARMTVRCERRARCLAAPCRPWRPDAHRLFHPAFALQYMYIYSDIKDDYNLYIDNIRFVPGATARRLRGDAATPAAAGASSSPAFVPRRSVVRLYRGHPVEEDEE